MSGIQGLIRLQHRAGFMNEQHIAAIITWHTDEDNNNDDDNYHQQLKAKMAEWQTKAKWASKLPGGMGAPPPPSSPSHLGSAHTTTRSSLLEVQNSVEWEELCGWTKCCKMTGTIMTMNFMSPSHRARDAWLGWLVQLNCYRYSGRWSYYPRWFCQLLLQQNDGGHSWMAHEDTRRNISVQSTKV